MVIQDSLKERGQGLVEYALVIMLVALIVIVMLLIFGQQVSNTYCTAIDSLFNVTGPTCP